MFCAKINRMKKAILNVILSLLFLYVTAILILQFTSEWQFNSAKNLGSSYSWEKANVEFNRAIRSNPFNASYFAGYAEFLKSIAPYRDTEILLLRQAEKLFAQASMLDPMNAEYLSGIGEIKLGLFLKDKNKYKEELNGSLKYFKKALKNDPNGFNTSYVIGYRAIEAWPYLDDEFKKLVIERLRYVLTQRYWYQREIYPWAWRNSVDFNALEGITPSNEKAHRELLYFIEDNNLYQFYKREDGLVNFYMKKEEPEKFFKREREKLERIERLKNEYRNKLKSIEIDGNSLSPSDWHGKAFYGDDEFKDGAMYWKGTMSAVVNMQDVPATLIIQARGEQADNIYPYMIVEIDGKEIGETFVNNEEWKEYTFPFKAGAGIRVLSITFCNDGGDPKKHEDRNLYIGKARIVSNAQ